MLRLACLVFLLWGCNPRLPAIPDDERATCADGHECRSIQIGHTLIRGRQGQPLFTELVTDNPAAFENLSTLSASLERADAHLAPDFTPTRPSDGYLCPMEATDKIIQAIHTKRIPMETYLGLCNDEVIGAYGVVLRADGRIACIENTFGLICP